LLIGRALTGVVREAATNARAYVMIYAVYPALLHSSRWVVADLRSSHARSTMRRHAAILGTGHLPAR